MHGGCRSLSLFFEEGVVVLADVKPTSLVCMSVIRSLSGVPDCGCVSS